MIFIKKLILIVSIQFFISCFSYGKQDDILRSIEKMSISDRENLENFFQYLIKNEPIGYVIFGDKPMALCKLYSKLARLTLRYPHMISTYHLWNGVLVWKTYQNSFIMENFIFRIAKSPISKFQHELILVNKKRCFEVVQQNLDLFRNKLGYSVTPEKILEQLGSKEDILEDVLQGHEDLLGILLGFGKHNSQVYQKREELDKIKGRPPFDFDKIKDIYKIKLAGFPSEELENNQLFTFIQLPCFVEDKDHPESVLLRQKYVETQKKLCEIYSRGHFLEITLEALIGEKPILKRVLVQRFNLGKKLFFHPIFCGIKQLYRTDFL